MVFQRCNKNESDHKQLLFQHHSQNLHQFHNQLQIQDQIVIQELLVRILHLFHQTNLYSLKPKLSINSFERFASLRSKLGEIRNLPPIRPAQKPNPQPTPSPKAGPTFPMSLILTWGSFQSNPLSSSPVLLLLLIVPFALSLSFAVDFANTYLKWAYIIRRTLIAKGPTPAQ